jgi:hypothetical protein
MRNEQILSQKVRKRCNNSTHLKYFTYICAHITNRKPYKTDNEKENDS